MLTLLTLSIAIAYLHQDMLHTARRLFTAIAKFKQALKDFEDQH